MLAVFIGAAQNILSKGAKYSLFDPCKEMAYIPLGMAMCDVPLSYNMKLVLL